MPFAGLNKINGLARNAGMSAVLKGSRGESRGMCGNVFLRGKRGENPYPEGHSCAAQTLSLFTAVPGQIGLSAAGSARSVVGW